VTSHRLNQVVLSMTVNFAAGFTPASRFAPDTRDRAFRCSAPGLVLVQKHGPETRRFAAGPIHDHRNGVAGGAAARLPIPDRH